MAESRWILVDADQMDRLRGIHTPGAFEFEEERALMEILDAWENGPRPNVNSLHLEQSHYPCVKCGQRITLLQAKGGGPVLVLGAAALRWDAGSFVHADCLTDEQFARLAERQGEQ